MTTTLEENRGQGDSVLELYKEGMEYKFKEDLVNALECFLKAVKIHEQNNVSGKSHIDYITILCEITSIYAFLVMHEDAMLCCDKALEAEIGKHITRVEQEIFLNMIEIYKEHGYLQKALDCYRKVEDIGQALNLGVGIELFQAGRLNTEATIFSNKGQFDKAIEYYHKAIATLSKLDEGEVCMKALIWVNIAKIYEQRREFDKAIESYYAGLTNLKNENFFEKAIIYNDIGAVHKKKGDFDNARKYCAHSWKAVGGITDPEEAKFIKASLYENMGDINYAQKKFKDAMQYYSKVLDVISSGPNTNPDLKFEPNAEQLKAQIAEIKHLMHLTSDPLPDSGIIPPGEVLPVEMAVTTTTTTDDTPLAGANSNI